MLDGSVRRREGQGAVHDLPARLDVHGVQDARIRQRGSGDDRGPDRAPGDRDRLLRQLEGRIRESIVRSRAKLECDLAAERKAAIGRERERLNTELQRREERIKQLVERYNALVEEGKVAEAREVLLAFHAGLFNLGGEGQAQLGGLGVAVVLLYTVPWPHWTVALAAATLGAALFGAAWAAIPAYLQAKRGSHIVITTIMFNYIAGSLMIYLLVDILRPFGIIEMVRTGVVSMRRGAEAVSANPPLVAALIPEVALN
jgi:acetolactate synthase small subunit